MKAFDWQSAVDSFIWGVGKYRSSTSERTSKHVESIDKYSLFTKVVVCRCKRTTLLKLRLAALDCGVTKCHITYDTIIYKDYQNNNKNNNNNRH